MLTHLLNRILSTHANVLSRILPLFYTYVEDKLENLETIRYFNEWIIKLNFDKRTVWKMSV